jgi:hypothetical protein
MKKVIYFVYLGLLLFILIACEKENIQPAEPDSASLLINNSKTATCKTYSYASKTGIVIAGTIAPTEIIVGFDPNLTLAQKEAIMRRFRIYDSFQPGDYTNATGDVLNFIKLKSNATCANVEALVTSLENRSDVNVVLLTYRAPVGSLTQYLNGIVVKVRNRQGVLKLQQFAQATNTQIVDRYDRLTFLLRVDKNSTSDIFGLLSALNRNNKIEYAEPDGPITPLRQKPANTSVAPEIAKN